MAINYTALQFGGVTPWHNGSQTLTYSFLGSTLPSYYPQVDTDATPGNDAWEFSGYQVPFTADVSMSAGERALAELAVERWNEVANIHLVPGSVGGGAPTGAPITGNGTLVGGLGGAAGFGETEVSRNDDGFTSFDISAVFESGIDFFGNTNHTALFVNTNGSVSFGSGIGTFTPQTISGGITALIAPFWADVDTRVDADAGTPDSAPIYFDVDPVNDVVTITWSQVGYFDFHAEVTNSFQLQLFDRGGGDFDIVFRYQDINWVTGDASGGTGGLGGTPARAGYSAGNGSDFYELTQSGNQASLLNLENTVGNTGQNGLYVFQVRNGQINSDLTFAAHEFGDPGLFGFAYLPGTLGTPSLNGDLWINQSNATQNLAVEGNTGFQTYIHELGHALGLSHPNNDPNNAANDPRNNNQWTVMSYVPHPAEAGVADPDADYPITPMILDIQAMQDHYGANLGTRTGGTTYFGAAQAGTTAAYSLLPGALLANGHHAIMTIWDAGGTDWLNLENETLGTYINLTPGTFSTVGVGANNIAMSAAVNVGGTIVNYIENVIGGGAVDRITGNAADNRLDGRAGGDQFFLQSGGNDTILGGAGNDTANFGAAFTGADRFYGGGNTDRVVLNGDYSAGVVLAAATLTDVESILLTNGFTYRLTLNNGNIGATDTLTIDGSGLGPTNQMIIVGTALETDGRMRLLGGSGRDTLFGGGFDDTLLGGDERDVLLGRGGRDSFTGGFGNDIFRFDALADSLFATPDRITDFAPGDRIDLSRIDADTGAALDQAFHLGQGAGTAGDIWIVYDAVNNRTRVDLYVDNNASIDARIFLDGNHAGLVAGDFIL